MPLADVILIQHLEELFLWALTIGARLIVDRRQKSSVLLHKQWLHMRFHR